MRDLVAGLLGAGVQVARGDFTSIAEIRALSKAESIKGHPVRVEGVVLARFPDRGRLYVEHNGRGLVVIPPRQGSSLEFGARVRVIGRTTVNLNSHVLADEVIVLNAEGTVPTPETVSVAELLEAPRPYDGRLEVTGFAQSWRYTRTRVRLQLRDAGRVLEVSLPRQPRAALARLLFSKVSIRGVLATSGMAAGRSRFWVDDGSHVIVHEEWPGDPYATELVSVAKLTATNAPVMLDKPYRLRVRVVRGDSETGAFVIADDSGEVNLARLPGRETHVGDELEMLVFRDSVGGTTPIEVAELRWLGRREVDEGLPEAVRAY